MPKPIRITDEMKRNAQIEFAELLADMKMSDGKISYSKAFRYTEAYAVLWFTPNAYSKTVALVAAFSDEVAWHGTAIRHTMNEFIIEDIFVYPQEVTGSTVSTDQEGYTKWLYEFNDEAFNRIRMQGHSHVNMSVSPSAVDNGHREKILAQLDADMFYIFMVWNKRMETHALIYDMENNILYEDDDISVKIAGEDSLEIFLADAKEKVKKREAHGKRYRVKEGQESLFDRHHGIHDPYEL